MKKFDEMPKSFKKMVRFVVQQASYEQISEMEAMFLYHVDKRKEQLRTDNRIGYNRAN